MLLRGNFVRRREVGSIVQQQAPRIQHQSRYRHSSTHPRRVSVVVEDPNNRRPRSPRVSEGFHRLGHKIHLRINDVRSRSPRRFWSASRGSSMSPGPRKPAQSPSEAPRFLQQSELDITRRFTELEWQQRERISKGLSRDGQYSPWARLSGDDIMERNRYLNIDPWAKNRVHLRVPEGTCDYINASPIVVKGSKSGKPRHFIATQGPKQSSSQHFWQMIWQETGPTAVVVMLTKTHEAGREKCFTYFPNSDDDGAMRISSCIDSDDEMSDSSDATGGEPEEKIDEVTARRAASVIDQGFEAVVELQETRYEEKTRSTIRKLCLKVKDEEKIVWHYLFEGWPDFSVPDGEDCLALIELSKQSLASAGDAENPRIVHCSAGVGRSGTFIALDYLLSELKDGALDEVPNDQDRIADIVNDLRKQRMMMVQGESQFHFLYEIMKEQWLERHGLHAAAELKKDDIVDEEMPSDASKDGGSNL